MEKSEIDNLIQELGDLSESEEQNMERMKEIAHILVQEYMHPETKEEFAVMAYSVKAVMIVYSNRLAI